MKLLLLLLLCASLTAGATSPDAPVLTRARQFKISPPSGWTELRHAVPDSLHLVSYRHPQHAAQLVVGRWLSAPAVAAEPAVGRLLRHAGLRPSGGARVEAVGPEATRVTGTGHYRGLPAQYEALVYASGRESAVVHVYLSTTPWPTAESPLRVVLTEWSAQPLPVLL